MDNGVRQSVMQTEALRLINQNAVEYAEQLAKGWAPGSWEEANLTHKIG